MDKEKISRIVSNYNSLEQDEKRKVSHRIDKIWQNVYDEYCDVCSKDEELVDLYDKLAKIKSVGEFDLENEYSKLEYQGDDGDMAWPVETLVYYKDWFEDEKRTAENLDKIQEDLKNKLAEIENKKLVLFRENKINRINWQLKNNQQKADHYNDCMKRQAEKEYYEQNAKTLIDPVVKGYKEKTEKYAAEVILKRAESDPVILCLSHTSKMHTSNDEKRGFDVKPLNEACNKIRDNALFDVKCDLVQGRE